MPSAKRVYRYVQRFGPLQGVRNLLAVGATGEVVVRTGRDVPPIRLRGRSSDVAVFERVFLDPQCLDSALLPDDPAVIVDAGANIGLMSLLFAQRYPRAKILALEPEDSNYRLLRQNTAAYPQIVAIQEALWDRDGEVELRDPGRGPWAFFVGDAENNGHMARRLPAISMRSLVDRFGIDRIGILKVDVEGAEARIFSAPCDDWLGITRSLIVELHDRFQPGCARAFYAAVGRFPFLQDIDGENIIVSLSSGSRK